jgi:hypothetical protein
MKKVTIDRSKWSRGKINYPPRLLNAAGYMCCLGFACKQLSAIPDTELLMLGRPGELGRAPPELADGCRRETDLSDSASWINDSTVLPEDVRERLLVAHFARAGVELGFVS